MAADQEQGANIDARILSRELVYSGWYRLWRLCVRMPDGAEVERHLEDHGSAVAVLPYDPERRVATLVSMPRAPVFDAGEQSLLEAIAGNCGEGQEAVERAARAEAMEEAGLALSALQPVARIWSMPAFSTERISLFLAPYRERDRVGEGGGAVGEHENVEALELPLPRLGRMAAAGEITDGKTLMLIMALQLRQPTLFTV